MKTGRLEPIAAAIEAGKARQCSGRPDSVGSVNNNVEPPPRAISSPGAVAE